MAAHYYIIFDDTCSICRNWIEKVRRQDPINLFQFIPLSQKNLPIELGSTPLEALKKEVHLVTPEGNILSGAEAIGQIAILLPGQRFWGRLVLSPIFRKPARWVYRLVARHRHLIG